MKIKNLTLVAFLSLALTHCAYAATPQEIQETCVAIDGYVAKLGDKINAVQNYIDKVDLLIKNQAELPEVNKLLGKLGAAFSLEEED